MVESCHTRFPDTMGTSPFILCLARFLHTPWVGICAIKGCSWSCLTVVWNTMARQTKTAVRTLKGSSPTIRCVLTIKINTVSQTVTVEVIEITELGYRKLETTNHRELRVLPTTATTTTTAQVTSVQLSIRYALSIALPVVEIPASPSSSTIRSSSSLSPQEFLGTFYMAQSSILGTTTKRISWRPMTVL